MQIEEQPKVSVIVPVYKAEEYIERCARSLFEQTLESIEYIFINDCTPDRSMEVLTRVLEEYPHRKPQVKILCMPHNSGQAAVRTLGMQSAIGKYMIHCDSDDWVDLDLYQRMVNHAEDSESDVVTSNMIIHIGKDELIRSINYEGTGRDCLTTFSFNSQIWNKLILSSIIHRNSIYPFEGINSGEDQNILLRVLFFAKKVSYIDNSYYHYWQNNAYSITHQPFVDNLKLYAIPNYELLGQFFERQKFCGTEKLLAFLKLRAKNVLLENEKSPSLKDVKQWCELWQETNPFLKEFYCNTPAFARFIVSNSSKPLKIWIYMYWRYLKSKLIKIIKVNIHD